jgi:hypothetical protein
MAGAPSTARKRGLVSAKRKWSQMAEKRIDVGGELTFNWSHEWEEWRETRYAVAVYSLCFGKICAKLKK